MATPTEADQAAWDALSRDEQLKRMRELFEHPDTTTPGTQSVEEIVAAARAARKVPASDGVDL